MMSNVRFKSGKPQILNINRFMQRVYPEPNTGCWIWAGKVTKKGYGNCQKLIPPNKIKLSGAHRVSYYLHNGEFDYSMLVCHRCDNPICVNPDHLFLGRTQDNTKDMLSKNRSLKGTDHPNNRFKSEDVINMRAMYQNGHTCRFISEYFNTPAGYVYDIVKRRRWRHI